MKDARDVLRTISNTLTLMNKDLLSLKNRVNKAASKSTSGAYSLTKAADAIDDVTGESFSLTANIKKMLNEINSSIDKSYKLQHKTAFEPITTTLLVGSTTLVLIKLLISKFNILKRLYMWFTKKNPNIGTHEDILSLMKASEVIAEMPHDIYNLSNQAIKDLLKNEPSEQRDLAIKTLSKIRNKTKPGSFFQGKVNRIHTILAMEANRIGPGR